MLGNFDLDAWTASDSVSPETGNAPYQPSSTNVVPSAPPEVYPRSGPTVREGDWSCPGCRNINFAKRTRCNKCGAPRPKGDGVSNGEDNPFFNGPPGLFKKGDWQCAHCGNVNWARRPKCNVCNAPKPTAVETPRTGRGGGHFDLQDPQDREQHLSDDEEYDEFGRKKKKKKSSVRNTSAPKQSDNSENIVKLVFPPPPFCYQKGRTRSMSSVSSTSSQYVERDSLEDNND